MLKQSEPLKVETWPVKKVVPYARNPRKNEGVPVAKVKASLKEFGWRQPIVVDSEGVIIVGHTRYQAALELGMDSVPVHVAEGLTAAQVKAYRIADNKTGDFAEWDFDLLKLEFADLQDLDFSLDLTGFDDDAIDGIMVDSTPEGLTDPDEVPDVPEEPVSKPGDVWLLGNHRLMCGDSTSIDAVDNLMCGADWDVCVFDPPYEIESLYVDAMPPAKAGKKLLVMWDFKRFAVAPAAAMSAGWQPQYEFIWDCVQSWYTPNRPLQRHKAIGVFGDDPFFNTETSIIVDGKDRGAARTVRNTRGSSNYAPLDRAKHIATVEAFPNTQQRDDHGHGKPVAWIEAIFNGVGGIIYLDLFGGSGSTLIACEKTGRHARLMELDPKYCDVIVKRWEDFTGKKAVLEESNAEG